jgi:hypothetical protein
MAEIDSTAINEKETLEKMTVEEFLKQQFNLKIAELNRYTQQRIEQFREESKRVRALLETLAQESKPST